MTRESARTPKAPPSAPVVLERAGSLANEAMFTVELQRRRVRGTEPEDERFIMRWWADLQFLVVALYRLRRAAILASSVPSAHASVAGAIAAFDHELPRLATIRNLAEHVDEYALDVGRDTTASRGSIQVGSWDGTTWRWADIGELNVDTAFDAAKALYNAVREVAGPGYSFT